MTWLDWALLFAAAAGQLGMWFQRDRAEYWRVAYRAVRSRLDHTQVEIKQIRKVIGENQASLQAMQQEVNAARGVKDR